MNIGEYTHLINKPDAVNEKQTAVLEKIVQEFPYFQSARAMYLKGLYNQNSFKYNYILKVTAAHTVDRSVLFDFITSDTFTSVNKELFEQKQTELSEIDVAESEVISPVKTETEANKTKLEIRENTPEQSILSLIKEAAPKEPEVAPAFDVIDKQEITFATETTEITPEITEALPEIGNTFRDLADFIPADIEYEFVPVEAVSEDLPEIKSQAQIVEEKLDIGKPLDFSKNETHSFREWLQLSKIQPISREPIPVAEPITKHKIASDLPKPNQDTEADKQKKNELIDRFIETNPKIPPVKQDVPLPSTILTEPSKADNSYLMTETLARVYLEQKKYQKAIQAYEILILKYPEKSSFFADRILDIKNLQQNNN